MPTSDTAAIFDKLQKTHARVREISRQLTNTFKAITSTGAHSEQRVTAERRYAELQTEWDMAFRAYETATNQFSVAVNKLSAAVKAATQGSSR